MDDEVLDSQDTSGLENPPSVLGQGGIQPIGEDEYGY